MHVVHELSRRRRKAGLLQIVVEQSEWPEINVNFQDQMKTCQQSKKTGPVWYDEALTSLTVSHLGQLVEIYIWYIPKTEDGYHQVLLSRISRCGWAEA